MKIFETIGIATVYLILVLIIGQLFIQFSGKMCSVHERAFSYLPKGEFHD